MGCQPTLIKEQGLWARSFTRIAGIDEAGRGAWAGPVVAAAVILPHDRPGLALRLAPVRDSKLLTARSREACYDLIAAHALAYAVGSATSEEVDADGIVPATRRAMQRAVAALAIAPDYLLIDALPLGDIALPQEALPKADMLHLSVAAASIVAKVSRDRWMADVATRIGGYGFERHKGYGTPDHQEALRRLGPACHHRRSFAPIHAMVSGGDG